MDMVEPSFDHSTFSKNRQRLLRHRVSREFFDAVVLQADRLHLLSDEHFSVDSTLIEAAASLKSFRPKDEPPPPKRPDGGNPNNRWVDFHDQKRSNATHQSTTDPDARLYRKGPGKEARLSYMGQALMENRHGLLVDFQITTATGTAERPHQGQKPALLWRVRPGVPITSGALLRIVRAHPWSSATGICHQIPAERRVPDLTGGHCPSRGEMTSAQALSHPVTRARSRRPARGRRAAGP